MALPLPAKHKISRLLSARPFPVRPRDMALDGKALETTVKTESTETNHGYDSSSKLPSG